MPRQQRPCAHARGTLFGASVDNLETLRTEYNLYRISKEQEYGPPNGGQELVRERPTPAHTINDALKLKGTRNLKPLILLVCCFVVAQART
jgi:hypothetical protein